MCFLALSTSVLQCSTCRTCSMKWWLCSSDTSALNPVFCSWLVSIACVRMNSNLLLSVMFGNTQVLSVLPVWLLFVTWTCWSLGRDLQVCISACGEGAVPLLAVREAKGFQPGSPWGMVMLCSREQSWLQWKIWVGGKGAEKEDKGVVCTGEVSVPQARHTRHKLLGLLQGLQDSLCYRALPICLRGQWGFSTFVGSPWLLSTACFAGDHLSCCWVPCNGLAVWKAKNLSWKLSFCFLFSLSCARSEAIHLQVQEKNNPSY